MTDVLKFSLPGKAEYVSMIRLAISSIANTAGFNVEEIDDIKIAVSEACTNVVCHGELKENEVYEVICEVSGNSLVISVKDNAGGYDMNEYREPSTEDLKAGGMGVFIIKALMDEVDIVSEIGKGTSIKMVKNIAK